MQQQMKPTLVIMAAGMGNRYGGLKQLDGVGPSGETIMDYSVFNAIAAGFGKVVFVIRSSFEQDFREKILAKYADCIPCAVVFQEIDKLPAPFTPPAGRIKPWGTNHALMMAAPEVEGPFCVINADDYYGAEAFRLVVAAFAGLAPDSRGHYFMVAYPLGKTLSESGTVSRGVCTVSEEGLLGEVKEYRRLAADGDKVRDAESDWLFMPETPVSMNFWGFTPDYFAHSERLFRDFLEQQGQQPTSEFYIPTVVARLMQEEEAVVEVMQTSESWFGVTYASDRPEVVERLRVLHAEGRYPTPLFH